MTSSGIQVKGAMRRGSEQPGLEVFDDGQRKSGLQVTTYARGRQPSAAGLEVITDTQGIPSPAYSPSYSSPASFQPTTTWTPLSIPNHDTHPLHRYQANASPSLRKVDMTYTEINKPLPSPSQHLIGGSGSKRTHWTANTAEMGNRPREKTLCFVRPATFFLSVALFLVLLTVGIGAGIGGTSAIRELRSAQLSAQLAQAEIRIQQAQFAKTVTVTKSASASAAAPTATGGVITIPTGETVPLDCPSLNNQTQNISLGATTWTFRSTCGLDFPPSTGPVSIDIIGITAYTLKDCAQACAMYNRDFGQDICTGVMFSNDITKMVQAVFANCFLKNNTQNFTMSIDNSRVGLRLESRGVA